MANPIRSIDEFIIRCVQESYLWIYDRTGVYVGTIMVGHAAIIFAIAWGMHDLATWRWFCAAFGVLFLMIAYSKWSRQANYSHDIYNMVALFERQNMIRVAVATFFLTIIAIDLVYATWTSVAFDVTLWLNGYFGCILIRDREPKDWLGALGPKAAQAQGNI